MFQRLFGGEQRPQPRQIVSALYVKIVAAARRESCFFPTGTCRTRRSADSR